MAEVSKQQLAKETTRREKMRVAERTEKLKEEAERQRSIERDTMLKYNRGKVSN